MELNGKPYVPPSCYSRDGEDIDLETVDFRLPVVETRCVAEVWAVFVEIDEDFTQKGCANTGIVDLPIDSSQVRRAKQLAEDKPKLERLRRELLQRIRECKGIRGGVCWALGEEYFAEILKKYLAG